MPMFLIEKQHAEALDLAYLGETSLEVDQNDESMHWLYSFLSADQRTTFCLFEAPSAEYVHALTAGAGLPPTAIVEVDRVNRESMGAAVGSAT